MEKNIKKCYICSSGERETVTGPIQPKEGYRNVFLAKDFSGKLNY